MQDAYFTEKLEQLLQNYDPQNSDSFEELYRLSVRRLTQLTHQRLTQEKFVHRWQLTDDVLQNASLRLYRALQECRPQTKKEFFLLAATMIRREILDMARQLHGENNAAAHYKSTPISNDDSRPNPLLEGKVIMPPEMRLLFHEAVDSLDPDEQEIVELIFYQGMTQSQAAEILGISERSVSRRWLNARLEIGHYLKN